jgi:abortive infection bacteriophage resistance protein
MPQGMRNLAGIFMSKAAHNLQSQLAAAVKSGTLAVAPPEKTPYDKPSKSPEEHLALLESRGLIIADRQKALHYIKFLGYFRLSGYAAYFQEAGSETFRKGTTFEQVFEHYKFDRKLRILIMDVLKRIEIAIRVVTSNHMSQKYGSHWFLDSTLFATAELHEKMLASIRDGIEKNRQDPIIKQYYYLHSEPEMPPSWMLCEIMSMGFWSRLYPNIKSREDRNSIARDFGLNLPVMESFLHCLTSLRNICAHHGRLWNRVFSIKPIALRGSEDIFRRGDTLYAQLAIIHLFIEVIAKGSSWKERLSQLFAEYPTAGLASMGFPANWKELEFWTTRK